MKSKIKKLTAVLIALMLTFGALEIVPTTVFADYTDDNPNTLPDFDDDGSPGTTLLNGSWSLDENGRLEIDIDGDMIFLDESFSVENSTPWYDRRSEITEVWLSPGVTSIADYAFYDCSNLTEVYGGNNLYSIGRSAFENCVSLSNNNSNPCFTHMRNLKRVGADAFMNTLWYNNIPQEQLARVGKSNIVYKYKERENYRIGYSSYSAVSITEDAFLGCKNIWLFELAEGCEHIGKNAFAESGLTRANIPSTVSDWDNSSHRDCTDLETVIISEGVTYIPFAAFKGCTALKSVIIPESVNVIGDDAFEGCPELTIFGSSGSIAESHAQFYGIPFRDLAEYSKPISDCYIVLNVTKFNRGEEPYPGIEITDEEIGRELTEGTDFTVTFTEDSNSVFCHIEGLGAYTGAYDSSIDKPDFSKKDISNCAISLKYNSYMYDGSEKRPAVTVTDGSYTLIEGTDYTLSYQNNINSGTAYANVNGIGNYREAKSKSFTIYKRPLTDATVTAASNFTYDGNAKAPAVTVTLNGRTLTENDDYTVAYSNNTNAGTATITVTGKGNYKETATGSFTIYKRPLKNATVTAASNYQYDGSAKTPAVTVKLGNKTLKKDTDYTVAYSDNTNAGTATVTVTGKGNYKDSATGSFTIYKRSLSNAEITFAKDHYIYTGSAIRPAITVKSGGKTLTVGADYAVSYSNNTRIGTATVTVTGRGNYKDSATANFEIVEKAKTDISTCTATLAETSYFYDGISKRPAVTVKDGSETLAIIRDYDLVYRNNTNPGTASVEVIGKGNYAGSATLSFTINCVELSLGDTLILPPNKENYFKFTPASTTKIRFYSTGGINARAGIYDSDFNLIKTAGDIGDGNFDLVYEVQAGVPCFLSCNQPYSAPFTVCLEAYSAKTPISSCDILLSETTFIYDGAPKTPAVTVIRNYSALREGVDYTISYSDNKTLGAARITVTGKGAYFGTAERTFAIINNPSDFNWGADNWDFNNVSASFGKKKTMRQTISDDYLETLIGKLDNAEYISLALSGQLNSNWSGSCYGMSVTTILSKFGLFPYSFYQPNATNLSQLSLPVSDENISSVINYYQLLQVKDVIQQQYRTVPFRTNKENIESIIEALDKYNVCLVGYEMEGFGGHAVVATGHMSGGMWTFDGVTYDSCILTCDPNLSKTDEYNQTGHSCFIYYNSSSYNWKIPAYTNLNSTNGARFNYIGAELSEINNGGYLSSITGSSSTDYVARIDAPRIASSRYISKVVESNGSYSVNHSSTNDIREAYSYVLTGSSNGIGGYNLYDPDSAYRVTQYNVEPLSLRMRYRDCYLTGYSAAGKSITFDKNGTVIVDGEAAAYSITMTFNKDYPTSWFTIGAQGSNSNTATLKMVDGGYILTADRLQDVKISADNRSGEVERIFSAPYNSVFIYEIDEKTIGFKVDADNNGTYETEIAPATGDADCNGSIDINDVTELQRSFAKLDRLTASQRTRCDTNHDGRVDIRDATLIQKYAAKLITSF